jgi:hypothetical protein
VNPRYWFVCVIILVLLLAACGGGSDDEGGLESANNTSVSSNNANTDSVDPNKEEDDASNETLNTSFSNAPSITTNELVIPEVDELEGTLIFVKGDLNSDDLLRGTGGTIYLAKFDGSEPQPVMDRVFASTVTLSPNKHYLLFNASEGRRRYVYSLDIESGEVHQLALLRNQFGFVNSWSPDVEWITLTPFQQGVVVAKLDGTESFELEAGNVLWTTDGQIIHFEIANFFQFNNPDPPELVSMQLIDPSIGEATDVEFEFDPSNTSLGALISNAEAAGFDVAPTFRVTSNFPATFVTEDERIFAVQGVTPQDPDSFFNTPPHCGQWQMSYSSAPNTNPDIFLDILDTALISDIYHEDERIFYERWYFPDCELTEGNLVIALESVIPGEDRQIISEDIYPGVDINLGFLRGNSGRRYAVSPDQQYVAWISGSLESMKTTLNVTHVPSGDTIPILDWLAPDRNAFLATEAFNAVFWVPTP